MAIEGVGPSPAAGVVQFQPRPQQNTLSSGTDNRAIQNSQDEGSRTAPPPSEGSANGGFVVTAQPEVNPPVIQLNPGPNDEQSGSSASVQNTDRQRDQVGQNGSPSPQSNSGSALNYSASGATNAPNSIGPAGRHLSLSV